MFNFVSEIDPLFIMLFIIWLITVIGIFVNNRSSKITMKKYHNDLLERILLFSLIEIKEELKIKITGRAEHEIIDNIIDEKLEPYQKYLNKKRLE